MKELTTFIAFLSDSLLYISNYSYENWLTAFSDATYFTMTAERYFRDALIAGYTDIDLWAQSIPDPGTQYHTQDIQATCADAYYRAAEVARTSGAIRSRMPFKRPLFGGLESGAHLSPAQAVVRQRFKSAIDRFVPLGDTDREAIYDRALVPALWYYNFFLSEEFDLIKRIFSGRAEFQETKFHWFTFATAFITERTIILAPAYTFDFLVTSSSAIPLCSIWTGGGSGIRFILGWDASLEGVYFNFSLIEFY